ncbi:hypothetical protein [Streptomyces sp. C1-2]|uniref:hypothetical protein n=1 Tax=Streptomyces sp. C1-2 TaxID=2720022 RepID=UPI0014325DFA|nr:hypothetical protein [Streptomyces sp. C1-2]
MNAPAQSAPNVQVVLSDCSATDAGHLFTELCRHFDSDRGADDVPPHDTEGSRPTMWTGTFDTSAPAGTPDAPRPPRLSGPVKAEVQGEPQAVSRLREALEETFTVEELGHVSGDQEIELELRLQNRAA